MRAGWAHVCGFVLGLAGCDGSSLRTDGGAADASVTVDGDPGPRPDAPPACGNGLVGIGETCDTAIASGTGACPATCADGDACTADTVEYPGTCQAACSSSPITMAISGDGCCPTGATASTDSDCSSPCGNGAVDTGETCDTAIASGAGACPTSCNDVDACTADAMTGSSCTAACTHAQITARINGDGCCPAGATPTNDSDCSSPCGNGAVDTGETCDTAIASGAGACPAACDDGLSCTTNTLDNAATCQAACSYSPITSTINGDGCCPTGATRHTDSDCRPGQH